MWEQAVTFFLDLSLTVTSTSRSPFEFKGGPRRPFLVCGLVKPLYTFAPLQGFPLSSFGRHSHWVLIWPRASKFHRFARCLDIVLTSSHNHLYSLPRVDFLYFLVFVYLSLIFMNLYPYKFHHAGCLRILRERRRLFVVV